MRAPHGCGDARQDGAAAGVPVEDALESHPGPSPPPFFFLGQDLYPRQVATTTATVTIKAVIGDDTNSRQIFDGYNDPASTIQVLATLSRRSTRQR